MTKPELHLAKDILDRLSEDEKAREIARLREKADHDITWMINAKSREAMEKGRAEGKAEGKAEGRHEILHEIVRKMGCKGMDESEIAALLGVELEFVREFLR